MAEDADRIMHSINADESGMVDFSEFLTATYDKSKLLTEKNLKTAFAIINLSGSGYITLNEIKNALNNYYMDDNDFWDELFSEVDKDQDGYICFEEFHSHM